MYSNDFIRDIFNSGSYTHRCDEQLIVDTAFLVNEGLLSLESIVVCGIQKYHQYNDDLMIDKSMSFDAAGGSLGHVALKYIGREYLLDLGYKTVNFEQQFDGYVSDIISPDEKIIIECGNTNPDKVFNYFKNKKIEQLIIIPYPTSEEKQIEAYIFRPTDDLSEFLIFREKELCQQASSFRTEIGS